MAVLGHVCFTNGRGSDGSDVRKCQRSAVIHHASNFATALVEATQTDQTLSTVKFGTRARYSFVQDSSRAESGYLRFHHPTQSLKALVLQFAVEQHRRKPEQPP